MNSNLRYKDQLHPEINTGPVIKKYETPKPKIRKINKTKSILLLSYITIIAVSLIYGKVKLAEVNADLDTAKATYNELMYEYEDLQIKANDLVSIKNIEEQAINKYGMTELKSNQVVNIVVTSENEVEVTDNNNTIIDKVYNWFTQLKEYVLG